MSKQQTTLIEALEVAPYLDESVLVEEKSQLFARTWQYACHVEKLQRPGDFVVCDIADQSIVVMRENAQTINAFYNVCAHRAARLLDGEGCKRRFTCPYHAWTYNTRGELVSAPNAKNVSGFEVGNYRLRACRVENLHGLVFVNLDDGATPLAELAPELHEDLRQYAPDLPKLRFVHRTEALLDGNWKVAIENFAECYHCELLHPEFTQGIVDPKTYRVRVHPWSQKHLSRSYSGSDRAYDFDREKSAEFIAWWLWPNFAFQSYPGGRMHVWKWTPLAIDKTHVSVDWYMPSTELADWEAELIRHHASTTFAEDLPIIERVQQGLANRGYVPGPLMIDQEQSQYSEHAVAAIQQLWRDAMQNGSE